MSRFRVCIIGAGVSGLAAIKSCLDEELEPTCIESAKEIGGVWRYTPTYGVDDVNDGGPGVYDGLKMNTSKHMSSFSDFPPPEDDTDLFLSREDFLKYLQDYADKFNLYQHIRFQSKVSKIEGINNGTQWKVTVESNPQNGHLTEEIFDGVLVCSGRFREPTLVQFPGMDSFKGLVQHAIEFKNKKRPEYENKRILVVGNSFTAGDVTALISDVSAKTYLSVGNGTFIVSRYTAYANRAPLDATFFQRGILYNRQGADILSDVFSSESEYLVEHEKFNLCPNKALLSSPFMINDIIGEKIKNGVVCVKRFVQSFTPGGVVFDDGTEEEIDTVVMATGYEIDYPFLEKGILADSASELELYELMWPLTTHKPNLAIIGCYCPKQSVIPGVELQSRWAARVLAGKLSLPSRETMEAEIHHRKKTLLDTFGKVNTLPHDTAIQYQDRIAEIISARPSPWAFLNDPKLAYCIAYGPPFVYHYRLQGPHPCPKARKHSLAAYDEWKKILNDTKFLEKMKNYH